MLKGQDIVVLAALFNDEHASGTYSDLGNRVCLSASETHAAIKRLREAALINTHRQPFRRNVLEFLIHGLRYAFPFRSTGGMARGLATSYAAPIAAADFATTGATPIWSCATGKTYGQPFEPLYATVPEAAAQDAELYRRLALLDMLRGGRLRERQFAEQKLKEILSSQTKFLPTRRSALGSLKNSPAM